MEKNIYYVSNNKFLIPDMEIKETDMDQCFNYLKDQREVCIDIETTQKFEGIYKEEGLDPYLSKIVMFQIGTRERQYVIDYRNTDISKLHTILQDPKIVKVGHNIKFEYKHILHNEGVTLINVYDTMIADQIIYCGYNSYRFGLANLNERYLKVKVNKETRLEFLTIENKPFTIDQITYGAEDVLYPLHIMDAQKSLIYKKDLYPCVKLEMQFLLVLGDIEYNGMHFNKQAWLDLADRKEKELTLKEEKLNKFVIDNTNNNFLVKQYELFNTDVKCAVSWSSPKQVIDLFKFLQACPEEVSKTTGKLSPTVNGKSLKSSLNTINKDQPEFIKQFIKDYIDFKETEQLTTTFGKDFIKYINPVTKRIHSNYKQILNTGRISSSNPNLQNIPSDEEYRKTFDAPTSCDIINADYSGQETVILANYSGEVNMMKLINEGGDMHSFVAKAINPSIAHFSDEHIKAHFSKDRQTAKAAGFAIQFGGTGFTIAKNLGVTQQVGDAVYEAYFKAFPALGKYFKKVQKEALDNGYILMDKITKRKNFYFSPRDKKEIGEVKRKALNYPIQGTAGSITKLAAVNLRKNIIKGGMTPYVKITNLVHDEINLECFGLYSHTMAPILSEIMEKAGSYWCKRVPLKATAKISKFWGH